MKNFKRLFKRRARKKNSYENTITSLKAELYDADQEIKRLKAQNEREQQVIEKIRCLPTAKKRELGIL